MDVLYWYTDGKIGSCWSNYQQNGLEVKAASLTAAYAAYTSIGSISLPDSLMLSALWDELDVAFDWLGVIGVSPEREDWVSSWGPKVRLCEGGRWNRKHEKVKYMLNICKAMYNN